MSKMKTLIQIKVLLFWVILSIVSATSWGASDSARFAVIGDYGNGSAVSMVQLWNPDFVVTTGDNSYWANPIDFNIGQFYSPFIGDYTGGYGAGSDTNRFFPSPGNHDYTDGGGFPAYLNYFTLPGKSVQTSASSGNERYYDIIWGPVHLFIINSNFQETDGINSASVQAQWLQNQLASSSEVWKIVVMHHPPYSSSISHGSTPMMQWPYEQWGADLVLTGHDHTYERIHRDDDLDGNQMVYFVNGLGGRSIYGFPVSGFVGGSMIRYNGDYGAMLMEATADSLHCWFWSISGNPPGTLIDSLTIINNDFCCDLAGDANNSGTINILDVSFILSFLYRNTSPSACPDKMNVNGNGPIDLIDLVRLIDYLYKRGNNPICP